MQQRQPSEEPNKWTLWLRAIFGLVLAPLDGLYGFLKETFYFFKSWAITGSTTDFFYSNFDPNRPLTRDDEAGRYLSGTTTLGRVGTVLFATLAILGFIGAIVAPFPGVTPLYTASLLGIAKAVGITISWAIVGRAAGSLIGATIDFFKLSKIYKTQNTHITTADVDPNPQQTMTPKRLATGMIIHALTASLTGEAGQDVATAIRLRSHDAIDKDPSSQSTDESQPEKDKSQPEKDKSQSEEDKSQPVSRGPSQ